MATRSVYLLKFGRTRSQRAHFAIFVPNSTDSDPTNRNVECKGTLIHVVGTPMSGYIHEFKRDYNSSESQSLAKAVYLGDIASDLVAVPARGLGVLEKLAERLPAPRKNENFLAPVNDTTNRRCQEWTMDYLRTLAKSRFISDKAVAIAQAERDPPTHGVGLQPRAQNAQAENQGSQLKQSRASSKSTTANTVKSGNQGGSDSGSKSFARRC